MGIPDSCQAQSLPCAPPCASIYITGRPPIGITDVTFPIVKRPNILSPLIWLVSSLSLCQYSAIFVIFDAFCRGNGRVSGRVEKFHCVSQIIVECLDVDFGGVQVLVPQNPLDGLA